MSAAEKKVKKLARLPGNCMCANCGTQKKFGFSTVCIKFHTFVCNNCKSSHQAISHRCKSLTMSSWADEEVAELERKGNDYARRTWLKNAPPVGQGGRPKEGDHVDVFKRFVVDVYERRRYYGEDDGAPVAAPQNVAVAVPVSQPPSASFAVAPLQRAAPPAPRPAPAKPPVSAPAPVADLLDFSAPAPSTAIKTDMFKANFDAFGSQPAPAPAVSFQTNFGTSQTPPKTLNSSKLANFQSNAAAPVATNPAPAAGVSAFSFIKSPPAAAPAPGPAAAPATNNFADFAGMTSTANPTPATTVTTEKKKPVMSNQSMSQKASLISSMDAMSAGNQQQQGFGGMQQSNAFAMQQQPMNMMQQNVMAQQRMMMQQQQMMMQQGMNFGMGMGMNPSMGMGMTPGMGMNPIMMNQPQMMNFGGSAGTPSNKNANSMNSLQMNASSMSAWTTGANSKKSF